MNNPVCQAEYRFSQHNMQNNKGCNKLSQYVRAVCVVKTAEMELATLENYLEITGIQKNSKLELKTMQK